MKKKILITGLLVLSLGASLAFAAESNQTEQPTTPMGQMMNWDQMKDYHNQQIDQAVKDGRMTAEQAKTMNEHMDSMQGVMKNMGPGMMGGGMMSQGKMGANGSNGCFGAQSQPGVSKQ